MARRKLGFLQTAESYPASRLSRGKRTLELAVFAARAFKDVFHPNRLFLFGRQEGGLQRNVADHSAGDIELGQSLVVEPLDWSSRRKNTLPYHRRRAASGYWNCTIKRMRRTKAGSITCFMLVVRMATP